MNSKLILAAAAVVGLASTAQAADLAKKAPAAANYVKVCDAYGAGYFYIPGSETCLKIGGYVWADVRAGSGDLQGKTFAGADKSGMYGSARSQHAVTFYTRADVNFDARTATEMGLLRSFIEIRTNVASGSLGAAAQPTYLKKGFLQFGGLTAGFSQSFYDYFVGNGVNLYEPHWSDEITNLLAYTFSFGNGVTATLSIEDPTNNRRAGGSTGSVSEYGGVKMPDIVGNVNVKQAWGSAQLMGAFHQNYAASSIYGDKAGFAIGGGVTINLPSLGATDAVVLQANYGQGALNYVTVNSASSDLVKNYTGGLYDFYGVGTSIEQTKAWSVSAAFHHDFSKQIATNIEAGYVNIDTPKSVSYDYKGGLVTAEVIWMPVSGFKVIPNVGFAWASVSPASGSSKDVSAALGGLRIQRNF